MALPLGQTGTADPIESEYFTWKSADRGFQVHIHLDAINGLARDVIERSEGLPVEVGGLLLGHAGRGDKPVIWIERYQRVECEHRSGPHFILEEDEHRSLEQLAVELSGSNGELNVVGFYRSHLRPGFQMEAPDFELTDRYFKDAEDLFLLVKPAAELIAQFFVRERAADGSIGEIRAANPSFPFQGRLLGVPEKEDPRERTGKSTPVNPPGERLGRLVPDFVPAGEPARPAREFFMESRPMPSLLTATEDLNPSHGFLRRRWPILAALLLVGGGAAVFLQQAAHRDSPLTSETSAIRPLGLYVNPSGDTWRISWNPSATALQGARGVQMFVHDGDEPNRIELSPEDLKSGTYQYQAKAPDVTFRMEVTQANGEVSAESFRLMKSVEKVPAAAAAPAPVASTKLVAVKQVAPVVPASIRPRIKGTIPVDVRVRIDAKGRVTSATPTTRAHSGLESFLEERAVTAAKQWRFEPNNEGSEIIHFTFKK